MLYNLNMNVKRVIPSGYCKGVVNAIKLARNAKENNPDTNVYILGMLVHNSYVSLELANMGIITLDDSIKSKEELIDDINDGVVIFTAHGISESIKQKVIDKGLKYVDATCVDVKKTQDIIKQYLSKNYDVIYFGKNKHPEAQAILSISNRIHLVTNIDDIDKLDIDNQNIFLTNQTTMSYLELKDLIDIVKDKYPDIIIEKEICDATGSRQKAISDLTDCDLLYVVGDKKSNNTNKLVDIGKGKGIKTILIQSYKDININDLKDKENIYVSAGASTPPHLIDEVIKYLNSI